jgi:diacylglycerol kinase family enzyme
LISIPLVVNPIAGGGRLVRSRLDLDAVAHSCGVRLRWLPTEGPGHGEELAAELAAASCPMVLAYGGDGTYNEVARGLLGSDSAMGVLPGGTTSVLAYEFAIPRPAPRSLLALLGGRDRTMRVGRTDRDDIFLLMLSTGPDAKLLQLLRPGFKRLGGRTAIAARALIFAMGRSAMPSFRVHINGEATTGGWTIVGNARCYGGPYHATPGADPFGDRLEVVVQRAVGRRAALPFALSIPLARHVRRRDVLRRGVDRVSIEQLPGAAEVPYQVDGDLAGRLPVSCWVDPEGVVVRLPGD